MLAAMAELGCRRNLTARALARRQSDTIGVIAFDTTLHGPAITLVSLEHAARAAGLEVDVVIVPAPDPRTFADAVDRWSPSRCAGSWCREDRIEDRPSRRPAAGGDRGRTHRP